MYISLLRHIFPNQSLILTLMSQGLIYNLDCFLLDQSCQVVQLLDEYFAIHYSICPMDYNPNGLQDDIYLVHASAILHH